MQKSKTGKFSIFSSLDAKLEFLTSRVESRQVENMLNSTQVELKMWATRLWIESNSKCQLETQLDDQSSKNNASNDDLMHSKCIFTCFCIYTSCDCILDTLNTDALCNLNRRTVWSLYQFHDILSYWSACSSSQRWLCISSVKCISSAHFFLWITQSFQSSFLNVYLYWSWWAFSSLFSLYS